MKKFFVITVLLLLAKVYASGTTVDIPMDKSWYLMRHTRDAQCTILSSGIELKNDNINREYAAISRRYTVDLTKTPWFVAKISKVNGGGEFKVACGSKKVQFLAFNKAGSYQINLANLLKTKGKQKIQISCYVIGTKASAQFTKISFAEKAQKLSTNEKEFYIVPTFVNAAYYYSSKDIGNITPFFRKNGNSNWQKGMDAAYDPVTAQYRGSIVRLNENTGYELKLIDKNGNTIKSGTFTTWANDVKISRTIVIDPAKLTKPFVIRDQGDPENWIRYTQKPGTVIASAIKDSVIKLENAKYVILDGLKIKGGHKHAVELNNCHYVRVSNCDISGWGIIGEQRCDYNGRFHIKGKSPSGYGINYNGAINIMCGKGIVVERCYIHDPRNSANSWFYNHPAGPQAITVASPESSVIRYNDFVGSDERRFNDAVESIGNFSDNGGLNRDADVYGNFMIYCNDDNIELDGGQQNVRCFDNRFEGSYCGVSIQGCMKGPSYVYNNIFLNMGDEFGAVGYTLKSCSGSNYGPYARSYIFNNTFTGNGIGTNIDNIMDYRNNIWCGLRKIDGSNKPHTDYANVFESGKIGDSALHSSTMYGNPELKDVSKANLRLSAKSPFIGKGVEIPNFAVGKNINPGAFLENKDIPVRPLPVNVVPGQLNFAFNEGNISGSGKVLVKASDENFSGNFSVCKNDAFSWFEVFPSSGKIRSGSSVELTVSIKQGFVPKYRKYRGAFLVRFENGLSRPVSVYMDTDYKVEPYPTKDGVSTIYVDLTNPTRGKKYRVIEHPAGGHGKVLDFKSSCYKISSKKFTGAKNDLAEYEFDIPKTGEYMIMLRGMNQDNSQMTSSCFMSLDGAPVSHQALTPLFSPENRMSWVFIKLPQSLRKAPDCKVVKLKKGKHILRIAPRKPIYLDHLCITTDPRIFEDR